MKALTYLASPYTHPDPEVMAARFDAVCAVAARLMLAGEAVFSPIAHSHPIALQIPETQTDGAFWLAQDFPILCRCTLMKVLMLEGWSMSKGIAAEVQFATNHRIPVEFITP